MKKYLLLVLVGIFSCLQLSAQSSNNASPKHEFRATWFATVTNIDWPSAHNLSAAQQKEELNSILNSLRDANINAVCFQVRSQCDAFYKSEYEPWAAELTGTRGEDPGYDPLQYAIEQAHARGIEIHVWVNPFRVVSHKIMPKDETPGEQNSAYRYHPISNSDLLFTHTGSTVTPDMVIEYTTDTKYDANKQVEANTTKFGQVLNPGYEGVRQHIVKVILDIVERYDIDGVVMDDYFYPSVDALTPDDYDRDIRPANFDAIKDVNKNGNKVDDWRRSNVDNLIQRIYNGIKDSSKPWVRFGMGPGGVWSNEPDAHAAYGLTMPSTAAKASNPYSSLCCNTVEWIKRGWVDYVNPQIYWTMDASVANYVELCKWWGNICELYSNEKQRVHFYPSQAGYKVYNYDTKNSKYAYPEFGEGNPAEIINQINEVNRENLSSGYTGSVIFSNKDFLKMKDAVKAACYQHKALVPPMAWKSTETLAAPNTLRISGNTLTWQHDDAERFTVYVYPKGVRMSQAIEDVTYLKGVVYGTEFTLPNSFNSTTHNVAVRSYDRYGVEHEAAEYGPDVTYVLNGGVVRSEAQITVPTNEELWEAFMTYFNEYYPANTTTAKGITFPRPERGITEVTSFWYGASDGSYVTDANANIMTNTNSKYKWLGDYIKKVTTDQGYTIPDETYWRHNLWAFFNCTQRTSWPATADFSTAGKPEAWGPAYLAAHSNTNVEPQPTQERLIANFKDAYNTYYGATIATTREIDIFLSVGATSNNGGVGSNVSIILKDANSGWKWLGDYILTIAGTTDNTEYWWRTNAIGFFTQAKSYRLGATQYYSADFSTAGQPAAWKAAWDAAHTTSADPETSAYTLPDFIETALTLPTEDSRPVYITHPSGYSLLGWYYYDAQEQTLKQITTLPSGYEGIVYAQWESDITWVLNGGVYTGKGDLPLHVHDTYILPTAFTMRKVGHKFAGWYENQACTGDAITTIPASHTGTLYAKWAKATHVTWHPYPYYDVTNEDLWELFVEDYNAFYNSDILGENRSYENRAHQPIGNVFGFMHSGEKLKNANGEWINKEGAVVETEAEAHHRFPDGRAKDFMTHPQSPWKWLGDYVVETIEAGKSSEDSNEPLWSAFKEATGLTTLSTLEDYKKKGDGFTKIAGALNKENLTTLFDDEKWACLKSYIMTVQNAVKGTVIGQTTNAEGQLVDITIIELKSTIADSEAAWRYAVAAFFLQDQRTVWPASANFSDAGRHTVWMEAIEQMGTEAAEEFHELGHFRISSEKEWRKQIAGFFNHSDFIKYVFPVGSKDSILEETADFRNFGLPKPNGDPTKGWYNAWWNATFPEYMIDNEALPKIKRKNYVFGGWYYGNEKGYIFTEGTKADPTAYSSANDNYKNHLWGRWLELCLYEGYVDSDPAALDANEQPISPKVNNNVEMVICNAEEIDRTKLSRKVDVERKLIGGTYNTMFLPFGINGAGGKVDDVQMNGKEYYLRQVVDDNGNQLLNPATTSILVYDGAEVENIGGEEVIAFNFHEYADNNSDEPLYAYQPFLIKPANDITVRMHFWSALMQAPANAGARTSAVQAFVEGVLAPTVIPVNPEGDNTLILVADNRLAKVTTQGEMLGLRLYFTVPKDVSPSAQSIIRVNNAPAGIDDIETPQQGSAVIKIMQNGNIYIIRNGKMYDIMGRKIGDKR